MTPHESPLALPEGMEPFLEAIETLYAEMDREYDTAAAIYPFVCNGCEDNCCHTLFYHHTVIEYLYLQSGFMALPWESARDVTHRAHRPLLSLPDGTAPRPKILCPLNQKGRCSLYRHRPMICRLHGIPNKTRRPDGVTLKGPGCPEFTRLHGESPPTLLDRTPFYLKMAVLEKEVREALNFRNKFRKTVSEMITEFGKALA